MTGAKKQLHTLQGRDILNGISDFIVNQQVAIYELEAGCIYYVQLEMEQKKY